MIINRTFISFVVKTCFCTLCKSATTCNIGKNQTRRQPYAVPQVTTATLKQSDSLKLLGVPERTKTPQFARITLKLFQIGYYAYLVKFLAYPSEKVKKVFSGRGKHKKPIL
jgi:hypothetical protein